MLTTRIRLGALTDSNMPRRIRREMSEAKFFTAQLRVREIPQRITRFQ
jgi:hypothetical protein